MAPLCSLLALHPQSFTQLDAPGWSTLGSKVVSESFQVTHPKEAPLPPLQPCRCRPSRRGDGLQAPATLWPRLANPRVDMIIVFPQQTQDS